jgi:hypothetical protein
MAVPFLGLAKEAELATIIAVAVSGELLFVLGGEFWGRIKALFQWPGDVSQGPPAGLTGMKG